MKARHEQSAAALRQHAEQVATDAEARVRAGEREREAAIGRIKRDADDVIRAEMGEKAQAIAEATARATAVADSHAAEIAALKRSHDAEIASVRSELASASGTADSDRASLEASFVK